jgi:hypothetical protein
MFEVFAAMKMQVVVVWFLTPSAAIFNVKTETASLHSIRNLKTTT